MKTIFHNPHRPTSHYYQSTPNCARDVKNARNVFGKMEAVGDCVLHGVVETFAIVPKVIVGTTHDRQRDCTFHAAPQTRSSLQSLGVLGLANHASALVTGVALGALAGGLAAAAGFIADRVTPRAGTSRSGNWGCQGLGLGVIACVTTYALGEALRRVLQTCVAIFTATGECLGELASGGLVAVAKRVYDESIEFVGVARRMGSLIGSQSTGRSGFDLETLLQDTLST